MLHQYVMTLLYFLCRFVEAGLLDLADELLLSYVSIVWQDISLFFTGSSILVLLVISVIRLVAKGMPKHVVGRVPHISLTQQLRLRLLAHALVAILS